MAHSAVRNEVKRFANKLVDLEQQGDEGVVWQPGLEAEAGVQTSKERLELGLVD